MLLSERLLIGLQVFVLGFGGVFCSLILIYLTMLSLAKLLCEKDQPPERPKQPKDA